MQFLSCEGSQEIPLSPFGVKFSHLAITGATLFISICFSCVMWVLLAEVSLLRFAPHICRRSLVVAAQVT